MKTTLLILSTVALLAFNSCKDKNANAHMDMTEVADTTETAIKENNEADAQTLATLDLKRTEIENFSKTTKAVSMETTAMREKIKQKWSKIHYYVKDGNVVRIKTYPHESISKRTEEFYFDGGSLIMAVVEDNGENEVGSGEAINKKYYFNNGKTIGEANKSGETEYNEKNSDGEELLTEANEYMDIYNKSLENK
jgi:hypothetical protein